MRGEHPFWEKFVERFRADRIARAAAWLFFAFLIAAVFAGVLSPADPYDPLQIDIMDAETPPRWQDAGDSRFLLGTDAQGRDLLSSMLHGLRISIIIGIFAVILQSFLGIGIGLVAGYAGGRIDAALMRFADIQLSFSSFMVAIVALALFQTLFGVERYEQLALPMLILVIGISEWPQYARTVRAVVLSEKEKEYVAAAQVMGYSKRRILFRHLLPNTMTPVLVIATVQMANAIITEASLSFLGLGMPVNRPSLGSLIHTGFEYVLSGVWWLTFFPSVLLVLLILSVNLLGDFLRDALNPKSI